MVKSHLTPLLIGFGVFVLMGGLNILPPSSTDWIMAGFFDPQQFYLSWQFFRHTPLLQFPIGANPNLGMEMSSSIIFTDTIPLLALFFKPFSAVLGDEFQYLGLWLMLCYVLQYYFAYKLIKFFKNDEIVALLGACFFVLAPVFLMRTTIHMALSAHWMILAAFCLFFAQGFFARRWLALLLLGVFVQIYLFLMVAFIWCLDIVQSLYKKEVKVQDALAHAGLSVFLCVLSMWVLGYFVLGPTPKAEGLMPGMNLLALFNPGVGMFGPDPAWTKIIPPINLVQGDGFMFLGLGNIFLLLSAITIWFLSPPLGLSRPTKYALWALIALLTIISLSNEVYFGEYKLISYPLFKLTEYFYAVFRAYGRMFSPIYYLIILFSIVIVSNISRRVAIAFISLLLVVHVFDMSAKLIETRYFFAKPPAWESPLKAELWNDFAQHYDKVLYVLPYNNYTGFVPWVEYAMAHRMSINMNYFSRVDAIRIKAAQVKLTSELIDGNFDPSALYVFEDETLWSVAVENLHDNDLAGELTGFKVIGPNLKKCMDCHFDDIKVTRVRADGYFEMPEETLYFNKAGTGNKHLLYGWSVAEHWGTWSEGHEAFIYFKLKDVPEEDAVLQISGLAFVNERQPVQRIDVFINDHHMDTFERISAEEETHTVPIPEYIFSERKGNLKITMRFPDAISPKAIGQSQDARVLAFGLKRIWLQ